ncbi:MAG: hypothetical protein EOO63_00180 [Hymenobacter sp.]|nr:MAG: hypothetical protein EOO63_00180 [Hymenobacter sp.]
MRNLSLRHFTLLLLLLFTAHLGWGQGATTASMSGAITDAKGEALPGATVLAVHTPTNTSYGVGTNADGRYNIQGMRLGGPYTIKVSFVGYQDVTKTGIVLALGETLRLDIPLSSSSTELGNVVVTGRADPVINAGRTGAETNVSRAQINTLPTLNRSLNDFTRLTPQAGGGGGSSFGGANNRYNNITIDGAVNSDIFGLGGTGAPGGQAQTNPIALDAIDQIQVVLAPYDVTLGSFTGAGVNAVTRGGTNDFSGSVYGFGRNQNSAGRSVNEPRTKLDKFYDYQTGARFSGPLVKDKVFFFVNYEIARRSAPLGFLPGTVDSKASVADLQRIATAANTDRYGNYDAGTFGDLNSRTESNKLFARLDFNLSENNTLTIRNNYVKAFTNNITRSANAIRFSNNAYQFNDEQNSTVVELNSRFGGGFSNKLILTYNTVRDSRAPLGAAGPSYQITDNGVTYTLGQERASVGNQLDQDFAEITDNLTKQFGKHTLTIGTHNEGYKFRNLFINNAGGFYTFTSIDNFVNGRATSVAASYPSAGNSGEANFKAAQLGAYLQDEYSPVENLRLTVGMRIDVPVFVDKPTNNEGVATQFGSQYRTSNTPSGQVLYSPRIGFNWDVNNDSKVQVRGGTGIFSGRVPYVWISNSYTNTGFSQGAAAQTAATGTFLPSIPLTIAGIQSAYGTTATGTTSAAINLTADNFKLPQVWRSNLAVDFRLPGDIVATLEGIYSKTLNDIYYRDLNLAAPVGRLAGPDQRPIYGNSNATRRISQAYTNVYLLDNTSRGYRYNASLQLQKRFVGGLNTMVAYTYGEAKEINSGTSSTAASNYGFNQVAYDPNNPELGYSRNDQRHRVIGSTGYTFNYAGGAMATTFTAFYEGLSGQPITYIYNNATDLNRDTYVGNDLLYVPTNVRDASQITLVRSSTTDNRSVAQIQDQLDAFIENDPYLRSHRGQVVERYAARLPWTHQIDIRVAQDFRVGKGNKQNALQITFDIINLGNLLNQNWGRQYFVNNNAVELLKVESTNVNAQPTFSFPASFATTNRSYDFANLLSRWQGQLGVRYSFN